jgi:hypothetical protein
MENEITVIKLTPTEYLKLLETIEPKNRLYINDDILVLKVSGSTLGFKKGDIILQ